MIGPACRILEAVMRKTGFPMVAEAVRYGFGDTFDYAVYREYVCGRRHGQGWKSRRMAWAVTVLKTAWWVVSVFYCECLRYHDWTESLLSAEDGHSSLDCRRCGFSHDLWM